MGKDYCDADELTRQSNMTFINESQGSDSIEHSVVSLDDWKAF